MVLTHLTVSFKSQSQNATVVPARAVDGALETPNLILKSKPTARESMNSNMKTIFSQIWCNFSSYKLLVERLCHLPDIGLRFALKASISS